MISNNRKYVIECRTRVMFTSPFPRDKTGRFSNPLRTPEYITYTRIHIARNANPVSWHQLPLAHQMTTNFPGSETASRTITSNAWSRGSGNNSRTWIVPQIQDRITGKYLNSLQLNTIFELTEQRINKLRTIYNEKCS